MLFNPTDPNCFAVFAAHNTVFLNVKDWDTELFFLDHLSHEGSHVVFNTLTFESKSRLFKFPYDMSFSEATGRKDEHSTLYLRFHGLFTFIEILKTLKAAMHSSILTDEMVHEAKGRIAFQLKRFENSLKSFDGLDIFREEGRVWYNFFVSEYDKFQTELGFIRSEFDMSQQSYDFNWDIFRKLNPVY